jgi:hypothetical protein
MPDAPWCAGGGTRVVVALRLLCALCGHVRILRTFWEGFRQTTVLHRSPGKESSRAAEGWRQWHLTVGSPHSKFTLLINVPQL